MTASQYRAALAQLGLSQRSAAALFATGERRSRAWALGESRVPHAVEMLLRLMMDGKIEADDLRARATDSRAA